jgi:RHS repeat-associated protein
VAPTIKSPRVGATRLPGNGGTVSFTYDPFGRRIQKTSPSGATIYLYDGANIVAEVGASGAVTASYTQGAGVDEPLAMQRGGNVYYYNADGLGSVTSLTNNVGQTISTYLYHAFGSTTATEGIFNPYRYTAREQDIETGLYYYRARYYDPTIGRFISQDPIGFLGSGTNFYAYVRSDPINLTDPLGLCPKDKKDCRAKALRKNGLALGLDVAGIGAGFLPGGDVVVSIVQIGAGAASTVNGAMSAGQPGQEGRLATGGAISSAIGIPLSALAPLAKDAEMTTMAPFLKAIPGLGSALSALGLAGDAWQTYQDYEKCMVSQ